MSIIIMQSELTITDKQQQKAVTLGNQRTEHGPFTDFTAVARHYGFDFAIVGEGSSVFTIFAADQDDFEEEEVAEFARLLASTGATGFIDYLDETYEPVRHRWQRGRAILLDGEISWIPRDQVRIFTAVFPLAVEAQPKVLAFFNAHDDQRPFANLHDAFAANGFVFSLKADGNIELYVSDVINTEDVQYITEALAESWGKGYINFLDEEGSLRHIAWENGHTTLYSVAPSSIPWQADPVL